MKILVTAATEMELGPFFERFGKKPVISAGSFDISVVITGAGMVATAFKLGAELATKQFDAAINAGVAGSFAFGLNMGELVSVSEDNFAEQGAEDGEDFLPLGQLGLGESRQLPWRQELVYDLPGFDVLKPVRQVKAITVNKVHGNEFTIAKTIERFGPEIESMEGAAFFYACSQARVPCIQLRAISNYVERRNREKWDLPLAIGNLNDLLAKLFSQ